MAEILLIDRLLVKDLKAHNVYGGPIPIVQTGTLVLATFTVPANYRFRGFIASGDDLARFFIEFNGVPKYFARNSQTDRTPKVILPNPEELIVGDVINLKGTNLGTGTHIYEGMILGEDL